MTIPLPNGKVMSLGLSKNAVAEGKERMRQSINGN